MSKLPEDPNQGKGRIKNFASKLWAKFFPVHSAGEIAETRSGKVKRFAQDYWFLMLFLSLMLAIVGYQFYDMYHPDVYVPQEQKKLSVAELKKTYWSYGYEAGSKTREAFSCEWKLKPEFAPAPGVTSAPSVSAPPAEFAPAAVPMPGLPPVMAADGQKYQFTCKVPQGSNAGSVSLGDGSQFAYQSETESWMEWSKALFGWILLPLILGNLVARWSVGPPLAGESRIALVRWWARSQALAGQVKTGAPSNATPGGATDGKGTVQITVIKPEDNKFRMVDFVGEPDIMRELRPFIEKAKAQRIAHEEQVKATREKLVAAKKPAWEIEKELASLRIPPIPEGRYGHQQNTMYLLEGKPGTGKSLLPLVAAGEAGITLLVIAGTLQRIFIGAGTQNLEAVVEMARKHSPCIVFWDEAEEGAKQRSEHVGGGANNDDVTAALLRALDGPETKVGIFNGIHWVLATNHVNKIDEAVKRSGRLKILKFRLPGLASIKKLLAHFLGKYKKLPFAADFQPADGAHMLLGKSGADIQELARLYAGYAEEVAEAEEKRLKARALVLTKRLSDSGGKGVDVEQQLEKSGLLSAQIEEHVNSLTFGQTAFVESVQRLLMGRKKEEGDASYPEVRDTAWHEGLHAVANAVMERLGLINWKVRFYTVASREQSLGLMWASPDNPENLVSVPNVLARAVTAYAGAMAQLVGHDDNERWGKEIDLYRDSGPTSDNEQAADLIHKSICMFGGSLYIGPICKGKSGYSWATEAGAKLVNDIDKETRIRQKLAQFLSWRIASIVMQNEVMWDLFDEVLNTEERLITQSRFYELFDKLMADEKTNAQIEGLPAEFNRQSQNEINALNWMPERQPAEVRAFIAKKTAWLEARYVEAQRKLAERALIELEAEQIAAD